MRAYLLLLAVTLGTNIDHVGSSMCEKEVFTKMENIWAGKPPKNIIKTAMGHGRESIVWCTKDYYPNNTKCVWSYFYPDSYKAFILTDDGTITESENSIEEIRGGTYQENTKTRRMHLCSGNGTTCFHKCSNNESKGKVEGVCKVSEHGYCKETLEKCKKQLEGIGAKLVTEYPVYCPSEDDTNDC